MKFYFSIEAGLFDRPSIRQALENSKAKILHWYPDSRVLITETKGFFESEFYFEACDLPDSAKSHMLNDKQSSKNVVYHLLCVVY